MFLFFFVEKKIYCSLLMLLFSFVVGLAAVLTGLDVAVTQVILFCSFDFYLDKIQILFSLTITTLVLSSF